MLFTHCNADFGEQESIIFVLYISRNSSPLRDLFEIKASGVPLLLKGWMSSQVFKASAALKVLQVFSTLCLTTKNVTTIPQLSSSLRSTEYKGHRITPRTQQHRNARSKRTFLTRRCPNSLWLRELTSLLLESSIWPTVVELKSTW